MGRKQKKQKTSLPPDLPPEPAEDDIDVSDEDVKYFTDNSHHARFVSGIDIKQINKHVNRVANVKDDALEALYEKRKKRSLEKQKDDSQLQVDAVDALPVKTPDGRLYYKTDKMMKNSENVGDKDGAAIDDDGGVGKSSAKLTKVERRAKLKKSKKDAKKQAKDVVNIEEVQKNPQSKVLAWFAFTVALVIVLRTSRLRTSRCISVATSRWCRHHWKRVAARSDEGVSSGIDSVGPQQRVAAPSDEGVSSGNGSVGPQHRVAAPSDEGVSSGSVGHVERLVIQP